MFYGREDLIDRLMALFGKRTSSLVTCRGRRRIGKSTLIEKFAQQADARFIKIEGLKPRKGLSNADELANFAVQLAAQTGCEETPPSNWLNALVYEGHLVPIVEADGYFDAVIPFSRLLRL